MRRIELVTLIAVAAAAIAACEVRGRSAEHASAPPNGSVDSQIRADLSGVRAEIELGPNADGTRSDAGNVRANASAGGARQN